MGQHPTKRVVYKDKEADIDEEIAPLILELWRCGWDTLNSCQDNPQGYAWVQFAFVQDVCQFIDAVVTYEEGLDSLYNRVFGAWAHPDGPGPAVFWRFDARPEDMNLEVDDEKDEAKHLGRVQTLFFMSIRFPKSDLPTVLERVKAHAKKLRRRR